MSSFQIYICLIALFDPFLLINKNLIKRRRRFLQQRYLRFDRRITGRALTPPPPQKKKKS